MCDYNGDMFPRGSDGLDPVKLCKSEIQFLHRSNENIVQTLKTMLYNIVNVGKSGTFCWNSCQTLLLSDCEIFPREFHMS